MRKDCLGKLLAAIVIIIAVFAMFIEPLALSIRQGLDLQGGTHVVLRPKILLQLRLMMMPWSVLYASWKSV